MITGESEAVMRSERPILIVSNHEVPELDGLGLADGATIRAGEEEARAIIGKRPLGGLIVVVDGPGPLRSSRELVEDYLRCQPQGRVAILSPGTSATIRTQIAYRPTRMDMFFAPWDTDAVRAFLSIPTVEPVGSEA
jgi:hypothetical protein